MSLAHEDEAPQPHGKIHKQLHEHTFEAVSKTISPALARYLHRLVSDAATAEDLLQETLIRMARGLPDFQGRSSLKTWAFTIATRVGMDHFRKRGGLPQTLDECEAPDLPDSEPTPDERLALSQMNACVREVIASLPTDYRAALLLHDLGGLNARETAAACGCSEANAKIRIHRARIKLKAALEKSCAFYRSDDNVLRCHRRD